MRPYCCYMPVSVSIPSTVCGCPCFWVTRIFLAHPHEIFPVSPEDKWFTSLYKRFSLGKSLPILTVIYGSIFPKNTSPAKTSQLLIRITLSFYHGCIKVFNSLGLDFSWEIQIDRSMKDSKVKTFQQIRLEFQISLWNTHHYFILLDVTLTFYFFPIFLLII